MFAFYRNWCFNNPIEVLWHQKYYAINPLGCLGLNTRPLMIKIPFFLNYILASFVEISMLSILTNKDDTLIHNVQVSKLLKLYTINMYNFLGYQV